MVGLATAAAVNDGPTVTLYKRQEQCGEVLNFPTALYSWRKFTRTENNCTEFAKNTTLAFTVEEFKKPSAAALKDGPTVTLYEIQQGVCGEVLDFPAKYAKLAEKFDKNLKEGSCESVGTLNLSKTRRKRHQ